MAADLFRATEQISCHLRVFYDLKKLKKKNVPLKFVQAIVFCDIMSAQALVKMCEQTPPSKETSAHQCMRVFCGMCEVVFAEQLWK